MSNRMPMVPATIDKQILIDAFEEAAKVFAKQGIDAIGFAKKWENKEKVIVLDNLCRELRKSEATHISLTEEG